MGHWSSNISPGSVSLGGCLWLSGRYFLLRGPRHCVLAVEQLSPYRPGLTVISPPALLTNRGDCFATIWDRQVRPGQGWHQSSHTTATPDIQSENDITRVSLVNVINI